MRANDATKVTCHEQKKKCDAVQVAIMRFVRQLTDVTAARSEDN